MTATTTPPIWQDGQPANTNAAMRDAYEWLVTLRKMHRNGRATFAVPGSPARLERCIEWLALAIAGGLDTEQETT